MTKNENHEIFSIDILAIVWRNSFHVTANFDGLAKGRSHRFEPTRNDQGCFEQMDVTRNRFDLAAVLNARIPCCDKL